MAGIKPVPLILAGGAGTRLWLLSRGKVPKQFIALVGDRSTSQQTLERFSDPNLYGRGAARPGCCPSPLALLPPRG